MNLDESGDGVFKRKPGWPQIDSGEDVHVKHWSCAVPGCTSYYKSTPNISHTPFPENASLKKQWPNQHVLGK